MIQWKEVDQSIQIELPDLFDFQRNLEFLNRDPNECMYEIEENTIIKALQIDTWRTLIKVSSPSNTYLHIDFIGDDMPTTSETKKAIVEYMVDWFDLENDLHPFYQLAENDPLLADPIKRFKGLRIMGIPDLFEALCWGVFGQQINLAYAYTLKRQFVEKFGEAYHHQGKKYWIFPSYDKIAKLTVEDLADIKMTVRKSEYIIQLAQLMKEKELTKEGLLSLGSLEAIEKRLVKIRGIGPWTANYLLLRCLRYPNAFPIDDVGLINAIKFQLEMDRKPTKQEIALLAENWQGWEAYATFYLWRSLY